jgi:hypothetical protein
MPLPERGRSPPSSLVLQRMFTTALRASIFNSARETGGFVGVLVFRLRLSVSFSDVGFGISFTTLRGLGLTFVVVACASSLGPIGRVVVSPVVILTVVGEVVGREELAWAGALFVTGAANSLCEVRAWVSKVERVRIPIPTICSDLVSKVSIINIIIALLPLRTFFC